MEANGAQKPIDPQTHNQHYSKYLHLCSTKEKKSYKNLKNEFL